MTREVSVHNSAEKGAQKTFWNTKRHVSTTFTTKSVVVRFCGFVAIFGFPPNYSPNPEEVYAAAKVSAEQLLEILCNLHSIEICHVVPLNVYGEASAKAFSDPYRGVLLIRTKCLLRGLRASFLHIHYGQFKVFATCFC